MKLNPYRSPQVESDPEPELNIHWYYSVVSPVLESFFWLGVVVWLLGQFISFVPGSGAGWFLVTAILVACGLSVSTWKHRIAAIVLFGLSLIQAYQYLSN